jgi:UDP-glucose 4-epimerase
MLKNLNKKSILPERAIVLGGHGFIGSAIHNNLIQNHIPVKSIGRSDFDLLDEHSDQKLASILKSGDVLIFVSAKAPCRNIDDLIGNLQMAKVVISALKLQSIDHLIYISSDAVYQDSDQPISETSCVEPASIHGVMHLAREVLLKTEFTGPMSIVRPTLVYGVNDPHNGYGPNSFKRLGINNKDIILFGEGEELRDHVYVEDIAELVRLVILYKSTGIVNAVSGEAVSFRKLAELITKKCNSTGDIKTTARKGPMPHNGYREFLPSSACQNFPNFQFSKVAEGISAICEVHHKDL